MAEVEDGLGFLLVETGMVDLKHFSYIRPYFINNKCFMMITKSIPFQ